MRLNQLFCRGLIVSVRRVFLMGCVCACALTVPVFSPASAQDRVNVRVGAHDDYGRLVFDWSGATPYTVRRLSDTALELSFKSGADIDIAGLNLNITPNIAAVEKTSAAGNDLTLRVTVPAGSNFRHFLIGNRVVLDVYAPPGAPRQQVAKAPAQTPKPTPAPAQAPTPPAMPVPEVEVAIEPEIKTDTEVEAEAPAPAAPPIVQAAQATQPHVINISATTVLGLAAFVHNGDLWIVVDRNEIAVPPRVSGPNAGAFPAFESVPMESGLAWRMPVPEGMNVHGEGGGLVWRVSLTPTDHGTNPITPERSFEAGQTVRGGTLLWPMQRVTRVLPIIDPSTGDRMIVATVDQADQFAGRARDFVDLRILPSPIGVALMPMADDIEARPVGNGLRVTRPGGLAMTRVRDVAQRIIAQQVNATDGDTPPADDQRMRRIFDFDRWMMGGLDALRDNQQILLGSMATKDKTGRVQDLLMLAKMNMANDRGQEAYGFLNFAEREMPEIVESPEFLALRGAASVLAGKYEVAFEDLNAPHLREYGELDYWRAYTLAGLEDWQQAVKAMPDDYEILLSYPRRIQERLVLKLAETSLRSGNTQRANLLLDALERDRRHLRPWTVAGLDYLLGEKYRQSGQHNLALDLWRPLAKGDDDLYRARASLAMTMLELQNSAISREQAIDRLEGLRYHWRGDELEAQTNFMLGRMYLDDKRYLKGFTILRDATVMSPGSEIGNEIASFMADAFKELFLNDTLNEMTPIDAVTVYEEFRELTPAGAEGNRLIRRLAERLVEADLLGRSTALLQHQMDYRLSGREAADIGLRLAAVYLLNDEPERALPALDKAAALYAAEAQDDDIRAKQREEQMLRARALSKQGNADGAMRILNRFPPTPDVNRLRADIAWTAGRWDDAADALNDMIMDEAINPERPLSQKHADLLLNRAVALNLAGNRVALANLRTRYEDAMARTTRARMFDVVTRPRTGNLSSDRESIAALVSEVDIFREFLDSYRSSAEPSN